MAPNIDSACDPASISISASHSDVLAGEAAIPLACNSVRFLTRTRSNLPRCAPAKLLLLAEKPPRFSEFVRASARDLNDEVAAPNRDWVLGSRPGRLMIAGDEITGGTFVSLEGA